MFVDSTLFLPSAFLYKQPLRRRWASKPLNTFAEAIEAFRTAMSFRFFEWLTQNRDVFASYKASLGFVWA
jgi:hypothetical protein